MSYDPNQLLEVALAEVGYLEKETDYNLDDKTANAGNQNYTKYGRDLHALDFYNGNKNGVAWCDVFVDWCFVKAFGKPAALMLTCQPPIPKNNCGAGCKYSRGYYKSNGQLYDEPQPGDQVFFYPADEIGGSAIQHTGLVYAVDDTYVYTVEGNTSGANGVVSNGGGVCRKKYELTNERLAGYGRPVWDTELEGFTIVLPSSEAYTETSYDSLPSSSKWEKTLTIDCPKGRVNLRRGNGTQFGRVALVESGTQMEWIATAANGWHAGIYGNQIIWVSGDFSKVL